MVQVRRTTYRGTPGYLICGRTPQRPNGWGVSIFTRTKRSAERIRRKVNRGEQTTLADFRP